MSRARAAMLAGFLALFPGCGREEPRQLWKVERQPFLHQIRAEGVLRAAATQKLSVPRDAQQVLRLAWLAADGKPVAAGEVVARFDRQPIERQLSDGERELQKAGLEARRLEHQDAVARGTLGTTHAVAELDRDFSQKFQKKDETVFSRKQIAESSIDQELSGERSASAAAAIGTQERLSRTEAELVEISRRKASTDVENARKSLDALEVKAPTAGIFLRARTGRGERLEPGGEMWPGVPVGELPQAGELQAEVYVLEADAGGLAEGQLAEVQVESQPGRIYKAKITRLDAAARPRFRGSPVQFFAVTLSFDDKSQAIGKLGQQVTARLIVAQRDSALVLPRQAIAQVDGKAMVEVWRGGEAEPVEVLLGPAAAGRVVVEKGLQEGELVVLPEAPSASAAGATGPGQGGAGGGAAP